MDSATMMIAAGTHRAVFDANGNMVAVVPQEQHRLDLAEWFIRCEGWDGWAARHPDDWYQAMCTLMQERAPA